MTGETVSDDEEGFSEEPIHDEHDQQEDDKRKIGIPYLGGAFPLFLAGLFWIEKRRK